MVLLYGLGKTNQALLELLKQDGAEFCLASDQPVEYEGFKGISQKEVRSRNWERIYVVPGLSSRHPVRALGVCDNEISYASRHFPKTRFIGVTGSSGKSTTVSFLASWLRGLGYSAEVAGNIGTPLSQLALEVSKPDFIVLELSSFQLHDLKAPQMECGVILNLEPNHLDWHTSLEEYIQDKLQLGQRVKDRRNFLVPESILKEDESSSLLPWPEDLSQQAEFFRFQPIAPALGVCARILECLGIDPLPVEVDFKPLEHRLELFFCRDGRSFYNDSKATTFGATLYALARMRTDSISLILGGKSKGIDPSCLWEGLKPYRNRLRHVFCYGELAEAALALKGWIPSVIVEPRFQDMLTVLGSLKHELGSEVLLSPGLSSLDQFPSFENRGRAFKEFIQKM